MIRYDFDVQCQLAHPFYLFGYLNDVNYISMLSAIETLLLVNILNKILKNQKTKKNKTRVLAEIP